MRSFVRVTCNACYSSFLQRERLAGRIPPAFPMIEESKIKVAVELAAQAAAQQAEADELRGHIMHTLLKNEVAMEQLREYTVGEWNNLRISEKQGKAILAALPKASNTEIKRLCKYMFARNKSKKSRMWSANFASAFGSKLPQRAPPQSIRYRSGSMAD